MKKLRDILSALGKFRKAPSTVIANVWATVKTQALGVDAMTDDAIDIIDSIITAVVGASKDDEDKAAAPGKSDKP